MAEMNDLGKMIVEKLHRDGYDNDPNDPMVWVKEQLEKRVPLVLEQASKQHTDEELAKYINNAAREICQPSAGGNVAVGQLSNKLVFELAVMFYTTPIEVKKKPQPKNKEVKKDDSKKQA